MHRKYGLILFFVTIAFVVSCGNAEDAISGGDHNSDTSSIVSQEEDVNAEPFKMTYSGIIRDESIYDECGFLIEVNFMDSKSLYQPDILDEKFKEDGLKVKFTFRKSRRQTTCPDTTPIIIETIDVD